MFIHEFYTGCYKFCRQGMEESCLSAVLVRLVRCGILWKNELGRISLDGQMERTFFALQNHGRNVAVLFFSSKPVALYFQRLILALQNGTCAIHRLLVAKANRMALYAGRFPRIPELLVFVRSGFGMVRGNPHTIPQVQTHASSMVPAHARASFLRVHQSVLISPTRRCFPSHVPWSAPPSSRQVKRARRKIYQRVYISPRRVKETT